VKKSSFLIIAAIFVISVVAVSYFGLKVGFYGVKEYVERIEWLEPDKKPGVQGEYVLFNFTDPAHHKDGVFYYDIKYRVYPDNASNRDVTFHCNEDKAGLSVDKNGRVEISKAGAGSYFVTLEADGGANVKLTIQIVLLNK